IMKAILDGIVLADSNDTKVIEGNHYFPPDSVKKEYFVESDTSSVCPWKGTCSYYDATISGKTVSDVAWYYPNTISDRAKPIENYVAFYKVHGLLSFILVHSANHTLIRTRSNLSKVSEHWSARKPRI
ncbi:hypothetical protein EV359DRAFT_45359, partial [Lentinula novae-zelandiae]